MFSYDYFLQCIKANLFQSKVLDTEQFQILEYGKSKVLPQYNSFYLNLGYENMSK